MKRLTVVDLFAGCGGLSLGLELVGFVPIMAAEINRSARDTYLANRSLDSARMFADVRALSSKSVGALRRQLGLATHEFPSLLSGGPPCQGFSGIGHRRTHSDVEKSEIASNHLYEDMVSLIAKMSPHIFLFENVRGLLSARWDRRGSERVWDDVRRHFLSILGQHYVIGYDVVHGYEYGVPQNRPRVLMVGLHRRNLDALGLSSAAADRINSRTAANERLALKVGLLPQRGDWRTTVPSISSLLGDLVDDDWELVRGATGKRVCEHYPRKPQNDLQRAMRIAVQHEVPLEEQEYSRHSPHVVKRFRAAQMSPDGKPPMALRTRKFAQRVLPAIWGNSPPHITVASLPDDFVHYAHPRSLTVREWARLQGFPDWYRFFGPRTTGGHRRAGDVRSGDSVREAPKYTQIGNAVPVQLAAALGWHFRTLLGVAPRYHNGGRWHTRLSALLRAQYEHRDRRPRQLCAFP